METKEQKFNRVATKRMNRLLREIRLIGQISQTRYYDYTKEDVEKMFGAIDESLEIARGKFLSELPHEFKL